MLQGSVSLQSSFFSDSVSFICFGRSGNVKHHASPQQTDAVWELIYVDQGELTVTFGDFRFLLSSNSFFIRPLDAFHFSCSAHTGPLRLVTLTFSCGSPFLYLLSGQILRSTKVERMLLAQLLIKAVSSARKAIASPCTDKRNPSLPDAVAIQRSFHCLLCDPQTTAFMERVLDKFFIRRFLYPPFPLCKPPCKKLPFPVSCSDRQYLSILQYLKRHLSSQLSIDKICGDNLISRSRLEQLFHEKGWHGVIDCFSNMKIDAAKRLIADDNMTFTQISATLGYSSVHYFSRQFKEKTKMTPTEYSAFLKEHPGDVIPSLTRYYTVNSYQNQ